MEHASSNATRLRADGAPQDSKVQAGTWTSSLRFVIAWLFPAVMGVYVKWYMMVVQHGFAIVARSIGRGAEVPGNVPGRATLTFLEELSFFQGEVLIGFLVVPLALWVINKYLRRRWGAILTGVLGASVVILFAIQLRALEEVGRYVSLNMALIALSWGWHEVGANLSYVVTEEILVPLAGFAFIGGAIWRALKWQQQGVRPALRHRLRIAGELYFACVLIFSIFFWQPRIPLTPYHESTFIRAVASLWRERVVDTGEYARFDFDRLKGVQAASFAKLSAPELIERYRQFAHEPVGRQDPRYFGKEEGDNVVFFILETCPAKFLPANDNLHEFPNLRRLESRSFVGTRHYTTLPNTRHAVFSVFSSWYPDDSMNAFDTFHPNSIAPDFLPRLESLGYVTAAFSPVRYMGGVDEAMFRSVGFQEQIFPDAAGPLPAISGYEGQPAWKANRIALDLAARDLMKQDLDRWLSSGKKFAVAFLPQVGHLPYPDRDSDADGKNLIERGRAMIAMQDNWLGEVLDVLQKHGQLEKTVIVILGDHGTRTLQEDPGLRRGTIDESSFHVPLYIYAPRALDHQERIPWLTSHIDVAPTVLDLLGVKGGRKSEQGTPVWDPDLVGRTTFLLAQPTFGADGYYLQGRFFMWHHLSDVVYANSEALFDTSNIVPRDSATAHQVADSVSTMVGIEKAWHTRFAEPVQAREPSSTLRGPH